MSSQTLLGLLRSFAAATLAAADLRNVSGIYPHPVCFSNKGGDRSIHPGRKLKRAPAKKEFVGDKEANGWLAREQRKPWTDDIA